MRNTLVHLLPVLACSVFVAADATIVINDLNTIKSKLQKLDLDTNALVSGVTGIGSALQVSVDAVDVDNQILQTTSDVNAVSKFSQSESQNVIAAIESLGSEANTTLADTTKQVSNFGGLSPVVLAALYQLKYDQNQLAYAIAARLDSSVISQGLADLNGLNAAFNAAILAYGGTAT